MSAGAGDGHPAVVGDADGIGTPTFEVPRSRPGAGIGVGPRLRYWKRIFSAYLGSRKSHLTFWHGRPEVNDRARPGELGEYWQRFHAKADYPGHFDEHGIPMLDYHGHVGLQYNPIAIAQYGLGNFNLHAASRDPTRKRAALAAADWLVDNLEPNPGGIPVWNHHFDWEYRTPLRSPWYSALSQGQGVSLLLRVHILTGEGRYLDAATAGFESFLHPLERGGVSYWDDAGDVWFEETVVDPPTHILNGFIWAAWGIYDYATVTGDPVARGLFDDAVQTLTRHLEDFDVGYWSLYDQAGTPLPNAASGFYHALHVVQLEVMFRLTGAEVFQRYRDRWDGFQRSRARRGVATAHKSLFKLLYY